MGSKPSDRNSPPPGAPRADWHLLSPKARAAADPGADDEDRAGVLAAMEEVRAEFVQAHGREPTEAEIIERVSLGLTDALDDDLISDLLVDEEKTILDSFPFDVDEDEDEPAP